MLFQIASDKVKIDDGAEVFIFPLEDFNAEEPGFPGLPGGAIVLFYDPNGRYYISNGSSQSACEISTTLLDGYIAKLSTYQTVVATRHTPSIAPQSFTIASDATSGTVVDTVVATITATENIIYMITSTNADVNVLFNIDGTTGEINLYDNATLGAIGTEYTVAVNVGGQQLGYSNNADMTIEVV